MRFCVKYKLIERDHVIVSKYEVQVLEGFGQKKRILVIIVQYGSTRYVLDSRVAAIQATMLFNGFRDVHGPNTIFFIMRQSPHVENAFDDFRTKNIIVDHGSEVSNACFLGSDSECYKNESRIKQSASKSVRCFAYIL